MRLNSKKGARRWEDDRREFSTFWRDIKLKQKQGVATLKYFLGSAEIIITNGIYKEGKSYFRLLIQNKAVLKSG